MKMIPKKIHYVWIGEQPKPKLVLDCIETWKKHLPDYQIIEWNNDSIKNIKNDYMEEALKHKKWAFASDYIRLHALYNEGGIYLDTDVEITKNIDKFLSLDFFSCYEKGDEYYPITSAVMGAEKNCNIISELLAIYNKIHFEINDGLDLETNIIKITKYFQEKFNLHPPYDGSKTTHLTKNCTIFPSSYFCTPELDCDNFAIHHFNGSWLPSYTRKDKLNIFNLFIFSRLIKNNKGNEKLPISQNEKIIFSIPIKNNKKYILIRKS